MPTYNKRAAKLAAYDPYTSAPPGWVTATQLAAEYNVCPCTARTWLRRAGVPQRTIDRKNAAGVNLGGKRAVAYLAEQAHRCMQCPPPAKPNPTRLSSVNSLAKVHGLPSRRTQELLLAAKVPHEWRPCPCCSARRLMFSAHIAHCVLKSHQNPAHV